MLAAQREMAKLSRRVRRARLQEAELGLPQIGGKRAFGEPGGRRVRDPDKDDDDPDKWLRDEHGRWVWVGGVPPERVEHERELIREAARRILAGNSSVGWSARRRLARLGSGRVAAAVPRNLRPCGRA